MATIKHLKAFEEFNRNLQEAEQALDISETAAQKKKRVAELMGNYTKFLQYYLPHYATAEPAAFHLKIVRHVMQNPNCFDVIQWARDHAKSVTSGIALPLFMMLQPEGSLFKSMLLVSKSNDNAAELLGGIKKELESNNRIINDFGEQRGYANWEEGKFTTKAGISFRAFGRGQSPRGTRKRAHRPDFIVIDDIDDDELVENTYRIDKAWNWILKSLIPTMSIKGGRFLAVQNNYADDCLIGRLYKRATELQEEGYQAYTDTINILDKNGNPSWASRFTAQECQAMIDKLGYIAAQCEYFNNPIKGGKHFKSDYIQYKPMRPSEYTLIISYCDPSFSAKGDSKAIVLVGYKPPGEYHILRVYCGNATINQMIEWHYDLDQYCNAHNIAAKHYMEEVFYQKQNFDHYYLNYAQEHKKPQLPIVGDKRQKPNKEQRLLAFTSFFESGQIWFNEAEKENRHTKALIEQLLAFEPPKKTQVDGPDASEGAVHILKNAVTDWGASLTMGKRKPNNKRI